VEPLASRPRRRWMVGRRMTLEAQACLSWRCAACAACAQSSTNHGRCAGNDDGGSRCRETRRGPTAGDAPFNAALGWRST